jgi:hypothetical protein
MIHSKNVLKMFYHVQTQNAFVIHIEMYIFNISNLLK